MRKKILVWMLSPVLLLACLTDTLSTPTLPARSSATPGAIVVTVEEAIPAICAQVLASDALNLRASASDHAKILTWLKSGEVVEVLNDDNPEWWHVVAGDHRGYARAKYLQEIECK